MYDRETEQGVNQNVMQEQPVYNQNYEQDEHKGFGIAAMILGIISLVLFCTCVNLPIAVLAIIFGIIQLVRRGAKAFAITGIATGAVSIIAFAVYWVMAFNGIMSMGGMEQYLERYSEQNPGLEQYLEEYNEYYE